MSKLICYNLRMIVRILMYTGLACLTLAVIFAAGAVLGLWPLP